MTDNLRGRYNLDRPDRVLLLSLGISRLLQQIGFRDPEYICFWLRDPIWPDVVAMRLSPRMH